MLCAIHYSSNNGLSLLIKFVLSSLVLMENQRGGVYVGKEARAGMTDD